jgi:hypothetical protein
LFCNYNIMLLFFTSYTTLSTCIALEIYFMHSCSLLFVHAGAQLSQKGGLPLTHAPSLS